jgi:hypothetical protein
VSPFFDELEAQLRSAAREAAGAPDTPRAGRQRRRPRRWWPARIDLAPVLTSVIVVLVVGAALVLLGHGGHPPTPPASPPPNAGLAALIGKTPQKQLRREFGYISTATKSVLASPECQVQQPAGVSIVHRAPDRTLLSLLAILRRPATPADRLNPDVFTGVSEVYAGSTRRALSAGGETYYLVVAAVDLAESIPSDRCFALETRALARYAPKIPPRLRNPTLDLQAGYIAYFRNLAAHSARDQVCVAEVGRSESGTSCGFPATEIKQGVPPSDDNGVFNGVVPDGVASVTLAFPAGTGHAARSVTGRVTGNLYAIAVSSSPTDRLPQPGVTWRSADGRVLKSVPVPAAAAERAACQKLVACALIQDSGGFSVTSSSSEPQAARIAGRGASSR